MTKKAIFLDYASTTPMSQSVITAMTPYLSQNFYNPSALYIGAKKVKKDLDSARETIAKVLSVRASEIVFTAGSSEANNLAIKGVMDRHKSGHCIVSAIEHDSVLNSAKRYNHDLLPVGSDGIVLSDKISDLIQSDTVLISVMLANNEIGTVQPITQIAKIVATIRSQRKQSGNKTPLYLHTDAVQAVNYMKVLPGSLSVDMLTIGGSKIYGPKQIGALYIKTGTSLLPLIDGGGQELGRRSGTENVAACVGFAQAVAECFAKVETEHDRMAGLQKLFLDELANKGLKFQVNGSLKHRLPNNVHITFDGVDNEKLIMQLDEQGIMAAAGSACSASSDEPSHVLKAIGLTDKQARSSLRFSTGRQTTSEDIQAVIKTLAELLS